jgi:hypothetical protein
LSFGLGGGRISFFYPPLCSYCVPIEFPMCSWSFQCVPWNVANNTTFLSCMFCPKLNFHTHTYINIKCKRGPKRSTHGNICVFGLCCFPSEKD